MSSLYLSKCVNDGAARAANNGNVNRFCAVKFDS